MAENNDDKKLDMISTLQARVQTNVPKVSFQTNYRKKRTLATIIGMTIPMMTTILSLLAIVVK
jgi:hypothetical protein